VSLDPPLVLICIDGRARTHDLLRACGRFCVNVLHAGQGHLCARFSGRHADGHGEFADCSHSSAAGGAPVLDACLAYLDCRVVGTLPHGDHTIFIGLVEDARVGGDKDPLIFFRGRFGTHEAI
jgi:flavin reductase (DIM6/NTAB) family NADH-FMN oxidoreductase RutF